MAMTLLGPNGQAITGSDGFLVPHARTFQALFNSFSRQYSYRYDEALRNSPANALAMKRDAYYIGLLQERTAPTINLAWSLETDDEDDAAQAYVRAELTKQIKKTPRLIGLKQAAMEALWYGRAGAQIEMRQPCYGEPFVVTKWSPVNGDKIQFGHDGVPSILVNSTTASEYEDIRAGCTTNHDRGGKLLKLVEQSWRDRFLIHQHDIQDADYYDAVAGGSVGGVGVRHLVYWSGWMRTEALTWMLAFMESVGMADLLIFNYLSSDAAAKQAAIANAGQITGKLALVVPRGANETYPAVESIQVNSQGVQFLRDLIEGYFDRHIERVIVGQTLSAGTEGSGLGGTGVADFHKDTKYQLIKTDVEKLDETLTTDLVRVLQRLNFPWAKFQVRWKSSLPDPEAKDKLESGLKLVQAGVPLKAMELRKLAGFTAPEEGDEVVGGQQQQPGMDGGMGQGAGALPPGGEGDPMAALGGGATTPGQDDPMAGMGGIGANDTLDPELQDALMAAIMQAMEEGDSATVRALCDMANDPGMLQAILAGEQPPEDSYASDEELWLYSWQGAQTRSGKTKAVGVGEHAGRTLYGARAEAALRGKQPKGPSKEAQRKAGVQERKQARQASAQAAMEIATKAMNGQATPDDFAELPNHLPLLNATQIRNIRRRLGIKLGGLRRRDEMAKQLIDHAKQQIEGGRATTRPESETPGKPAPEEVQAGGATSEGPMGKEIPQPKAPHEQTLAEYMEEARKSEPVQPKSPKPPEGMGAIQNNGKRALTAAQKKAYDKKVAKFYDEDYARYEAKKSDWDKQFSRSKHRSTIEAALSEGKTVPPEVLRSHGMLPPEQDQTDLSGRATTSQPGVTPEKPATPVDTEYQDASIPPVEQQPATPAPGGDKMAQQSQATGGRATTSDPKQFASDVVNAAQEMHGRGRYGNNKGFISHIWEHLRNTNPEYKNVGLDEFKQQLLESQRNGGVTLSRADLVQAMDPDSVTNSLTPHGNAEFHFVTFDPKPTNAGAITSSVKSLPSTASLKDVQDVVGGLEGLRADDVTKMASDLGIPYDPDEDGIFTLHKKIHQKVQAGGFAQAATQPAAGGRATTQAEGETLKKSGVDAVTLVNKIKSLSMDSTSEDINAATSGLEDMSREDLSDLVKDLGIYYDTNSNNLRDLRNRISNKVQSGQYVVRPVSPPPVPKPQPVSKPAENQSDALKSGGSELPKLRGTEKQAKWSEDVRNDAIRHMVHSNNPKLQEAGRVIASMTQAKQLIDVEQEGSTKLYLVEDAVKHGRELAEWIKANRGMDSEKTAKALFDKRITPGQAAIAFSLLDPDGEYDGFHETALPMFSKWLSKKKSLPRDTDRHNDFPPPEEDKPTEKRATKYSSVETSRGNRLVHGIRLDANKVAKFLELQKQGKIPDNVTAKKTNGKWDISLWGDSDEEIDAARREMASMGIGYAPTT